MVSRKPSEVKDFMNKLLISDCFDKMLVCEAELRTAWDLKLSGRINKAFFDEDAPERKEEFASWEKVKPLFLQAIKGNRTPLSFKIVFLLPRNNLTDIIIRNNLLVSPEDVAGMYLNIHFEKGELLLTSGTSLKVFTPDRTVEQMWDDAFLAFLSKHGIATES